MLMGLQGSLDALLADKDKLAEILKYHVVSLVVKVRLRPGMLYTEASESSPVCVVVY